ncbi:TRAFAC clade GTPase domain-containing protein [Myceligenerans indicum]|uniref:ATP/GTP-binding protein n=1 Tax=Myceligenerans indicum TaxID=2593663 RepID=A0ABS1LR92_9MICO|nr:ATP/GTP-binding protein [Myceligenerans indicum]MBL0888303.1 ATP/GTP-binding protein [Myceligenerans indicum]
MAATRVRDQHIAVFGGSGSGKTVLVSSFYGAAQEQSFHQESLFHVLADDAGQGNRLRQNYLGMKNQARVPEATRFAATPYSFTIKLKDQGDASAAKARSFDALRLVWHDYPGEWFDEDPSGETETQRRVGTFRSLLRSDVALILVDGQKLLDHAGEEERYLKSLFWSLREGILRLKDDLLDAGEPLVEFPRIWIIALSKADRHPNLDVHDFHDLVIEKAADDVTALHDVIKSLVQVPEALSMGEDFLLLSSARFEPGRIEVAERVGLDLLLPVASVLPLERFVQWSERLDIPRKWLDRLVDNADALSTALAGAGAVAAFVSRVPKVGPALGKVALPALAAAIKFGAPKIKEINADARANKDYLTAVLTQFQIDLDRGVNDGVLVKSIR